MVDGTGVWSLRKVNFFLCHHVRTILFNSDESQLLKDIELCFNKMGRKMKRRCDGVEGLCQCEQFGDYPSDYMAWVTDSQSAFIEGICDWAEQGRDGWAHPYSVNEQTVRIRAEDVLKSGQACFASVKDPVNLAALTSNEAHINGFLRAMSTKTSRQNDGSNLLIIAPEVRSLLLKAIAKGPNDLLQLTRYYDDVSHSNEGMKTMRRFFGFDYLDGRYLRSRFIKDKEGLVYKTCLSTEDTRRWFPEFVPSHKWRLGKRWGYTVVQRPKLVFQLLSSRIHWDNARMRNVDRMEGFRRRLGSIKRLTARDTLSVWSAFRASALLAW